MLLRTKPTVADGAEAWPGQDRSAAAAVVALIAGGAARGAATQGVEWKGSPPTLSHALRGPARPSARVAP